MESFASKNMNFMILQQDVFIVCSCSSCLYCFDTDIHDDIFKSEDYLQFQNETLKSAAATVWSNLSRISRNNVAAQNNSGF